MTFLALHEVDVFLAGLANGLEVSAKHVLVWAVHNSIKMLRNLIPICMPRALDEGV